MGMLALLCGSVFALAYLLGLATAPLIIWYQYTHPKGVHMLKFRLENIKARAIKRGWSAEKTKATIEKVEKRVEKRDSVLSSAVGLLSSGLVSAVPAAGLVGAAIHAVAPNLPVLKEFTAEAALVIGADKKAGLSLFQIAIRDIVPVWREIQEGDWKGALEGLGAAVAGAVAIATLIGAI
jgi:hypothetical protein